MSNLLSGSPSTPSPTLPQSRLSSMRCFKFPVPRLEQDSPPSIGQHNSSSYLIRLPCHLVHVHPLHYFPSHLFLRLSGCRSFMLWSPFEYFDARLTWAASNFGAEGLAEGWRSCGPQVVRTLSKAEAFRLRRVLTACPLSSHSPFLIKWHDRLVFSGDFDLR